MVVRAEKVAKMLEKALDGLPVLNDDGDIYCAQAIVAERLGLTRRQATETSRTIDLSTPEKRRQADLVERIIQCGEWRKTTRLVSRGL